MKPKSYWWRVKFFVRSAARAAFSFNPVKRSQRTHCPASHSAAVKIQIQMSLGEKNGKWSMENCATFFVIFNISVANYTQLENFISSLSLNFLWNQFWDCRSAKSAILTHSLALNFDFYEFLHFWISEIAQIKNNQSP